MPDSSPRPLHAPDYGRVWVVPNGRTIGLFAVLVAMCYAGASQGNGAAYLLCFLVTSLAVVSMIHAWVNLQALDLTVEAVDPVFVGEEVMVSITVTVANGRPHFGVQIFAIKGERPFAHWIFEPGKPVGVEVQLPAEKRGCRHRLELEIRSEYPLGFLTARQFVTIEHNYDIYPAPVGTAPFPRSIAPTREPREGVRHEGDDFGGTRLWQRGESQRHIDWKAAARSPVLLTKQWTGEVDEILHFDWSALPELDSEGRLRQLAKWIVAAEHGSETYELRLPGVLVRASRGDRHYRQCLHALAAFAEPSAEVAG